MSVINILQPNVYNLIAAGEVVERPASVIKELVENSIDAGAKNIDITIENGGISLIRVSDDGKGMSKDDLSRSILPHATSKIKNAEDLESIASLGFRGEALASIAAVSRFSVTSCDGADSYKMTAKFGVIEDILPCGRAKGTTCEVQNLFENTPARLKFLKKPKQEQSEITSTVIQLMFSQPNIAFTYTADNEKIFSTTGGLYDAIYSVYGKEIGDNLVYHEKDFDGMSISGYIGVPGFSKHNRNYQTAVINGRVVSNNTISVAASQAYGGMLMKRCYPVYVLDIRMNAEDVNVNVHPNKKEVRFKDVNKVFSCVYRFFTSALAYRQTHMQLDGAGEESPSGNSGQNSAKTSDSYENSRNSYQSGNISSENITLSDVSSSDNSHSGTGFNAQESNAGSRGAHENQGKAAREGAVGEALIKIPVSDTAQRIKDKFSAKSSDENDDSLRVAAPVVARAILDLGKRSDGTGKRDKDIYRSSSELIDMVNDQLAEDYTIVGQVLKTYLIVERGGAVYIIDQHAVHEKFIYEQYCEQLENAAVTSQLLLIPFVFNASSAQYDSLCKLLQPLNAIGFDICEFGGLSFKVSAVPYVLRDIDLDAFLNDISGDNKLISANLTDIMKEKLMQRACKKAIKSGDTLSAVQIRKLFSSMDKGLPLQCPHGRPAVIKFTRSDFDKMFKRIV